MKRQLNPWLSYVELFSALLVATFTGFILFSSVQVGYSNKNKELNEIRKIADEICLELEKKWGNSDIAIRSCGEDKCVDVFFHYRLNDCVIENEQEVAKLAVVAGVIKSALDKLSPNQRKAIELIIEGHADMNPAVGMMDPKESFVFNWVLSYKRAVNVLYEFRSINLQPPDYNVIAIGYGNSKPLCNGNDAECSKQNRRTTLRFHIDGKYIGENYKK